MLWVWALMDHKKKKKIMSKEFILEMNYSDVKNLYHTAINSVFGVICLTFGSCHSSNQFGNIPIKV